MTTRNSETYRTALRAQSRDPNVHVPLTVHVLAQGRVFTTDGELTVDGDLWATVPHGTDGLTERRCFTPFAPCVHRGRSWVDHKGRLAFEREATAREAATYREVQR